MSHVNAEESLHALSGHHPLVIEGMGGYDTRNPLSVATIIYGALREHWAKERPQKPLILVTQGDPYEGRGISAITRSVSDRLGIYRILVFLDQSIVSYHAPNADRYKVRHEIPFSLLVNRLNDEDERVIPLINGLVDENLQNKTMKRQAEGKQGLPEYYRNFALLQEVTKVACKRICGELTVAQTSSYLDEYSISSFYRVGLNLGLIDESDMVLFPLER
ncbi:MAG: shikimate kinase [Gammaproteobacteria bacterium]|nr:shikimate kinase [Gammaproteobacteria bacterium]